MKLDGQKRIIRDLKGVGKKRVKLNPEKSSEIKEAITKRDLRLLIGDKSIAIKNKRGISRNRAIKRKIQKSKGRGSGPGSRKGKAGARAPKKKRWMNKIRTQRGYILYLKEKGSLSAKDFRIMYNKAKGGFFRSKRHMSTYMKENNFIKDGKK